MPDHRTLPDIRAIVAKILQRIDLLERRLMSFGTRQEFEVVFSLAETIYASTSGPRRVRYSSRLVEVLLDLTTAGTTETIVGIYRNGTLLDAVTLAANSKATSAPFSALFGKDTDVLSAAILTAGSGAVSLTIACRFE